MKNIKRITMLLLSLALVLAFSSMVFAEAEFTAVKVMSLSAEDAMAIHEGEEIKPMPLPRLKRPDVLPQGPSPHVGPPLELMLEPPSSVKTTAGAGSSTT